MLSHSVTFSNGNKWAHVKSKDGQMVYKQAHNATHPNRELIASKIYQHCCDNRLEPPNSGDIKDNCHGVSCPEDVAAALHIHYSHNQGSKECIVLDADAKIMRKMIEAGIPLEHRTSFRVDPEHAWWFARIHRDPEGCFDPSKQPEIELREKTLRSNSCTNSAVVAPNGHSMCLECAKIVVTDVFKRLYDDACNTSPPDDLPGFDFL